MNFGTYHPRELAVALQKLTKWIKWKDPSVHSFEFHFECRHCELWEHSLLFKNAAAWTS